MLLLQFIECIRGSVEATLVRDVLKLCKKSFFSNISDDVLTETAHHLMGALCPSSYRVPDAFFCA